MKLRGGVIVIGSLLWDNKKREKWRVEHLNCEDRFQVYLPIRYGRLSCKRKIYTMVFSNICYDAGYGLGKGWIIPIKTEMNSFDDIREEASAMWKAESSNNGLFSSWGSITLLLNPSKKIDSVIKTKWKRLLGSNQYKTRLMNTHLKSEKAVIDSNGFLTIRWPKEVVPGGRLEDTDFLIATVTEPTLNCGRYPTVYQIAYAMIKQKCYRYFLENKKHQITTFQDKKIEKRINISHKGAVYE